jgi:hypothetical protein
MDDDNLQHRAETVVGLSDTPDDLSPDNEADFPLELDPSIPSDFVVSIGPPLPTGITSIQRRFFLAQNALRSYRAVLASVTYRDQITDEIRHLSSCRGLATCLKRTALGLRWQPGMTGGTDPYLCDEDAMAFEGFIVQEAANLNCITTQQAIKIAWFLKRTRHKLAIDLLCAIGSKALAGALMLRMVERPDDSWLGRFMERLGISIMTPENIERARRYHCNVAAVRIFFDRFSITLKRDPRLILNCDETHISSRKRFKVLTPQGVLPLRLCREKLPHFSAMCTVSASGQKFMPMIILPDLVQLPDELANRAEEACFVSTGTGWMTQRCFLLYVHFLLDGLDRYRQTLSPQLRGERFLLILDGHSSRWTYEALWVLKEAGVDVLVLPAHCSHVLQPFDVAIASPLKTAMSRYNDDDDIIVSLQELHHLQITREEPHWLHEKRARLIATFLDAWSCAACRANIISGFRATGLCPIDSDQPLSAPATRRIAPGEIYPTLSTDPAEMNCALVTGDDKLQLLALKPNKIFADFAYKVVDRGEQWIELLSHPHNTGRFLSGPAAFIWSKQEQRLIPLPRECIQHCFAYKIEAPTPAAIWTAIAKLAPRIAKVIVCGSAKMVQSFARHLNQMGVDHAVMDGGRSPEVRHRGWHAFQTGAIDICLTSHVALRGMVCARRALMIYTESSSAAMLRFASQGHNLIFFKNREELKEGDLPVLLPHIDIVPPIQENTEPIF